MYTFFSHSTARTQKLKEIQKVLNEPELKLKRATDTRWLSHEGAVDALRKSYVAVKQTFEQEAAEGDATAHGLAMAMSKPSFLYLVLFFSDVLTLIGNMSRCFQLETLNLLHVNHLVSDALASLRLLLENPFSGGFMVGKLDEALASNEINDDLDRDTFSLKQYLNVLIENISNRFPQIKQLTLLGYLDPRNSSEATFFNNYK